MSSPDSTSKLPTFARLGATLSRAGNHISALPLVKRWGAWFPPFLARTPGRLFNGLVTITCLAAVFWTSFPGGFGIGPFVGITVSGQLLVGIWLVRLVSSIAIRRRAILSRQSWPWAVAPVLFTITLGSVFFSLPLRARYELSQSAMDAFARDVIGDGSFDKRSYVGLWPLGRVRRTPDGMRFLVRGAVFLDEYGFAYSTHGKPKRMGEDSFVHLEGPWYLWEKSW